VDPVPHDAAAAARRPRLSPALCPPARRSAALATDTARSVVVLCGGWVPHPIGGELAIGDTWEWNGTNWSQPVLWTSPGPRADARLAFDERRGVIVLHGGTLGGSLLADTWEYDGVAWLQRASTPTSVAQPIMAWDDARQRIVLAGNGPALPVTYEFDGTTWSTLATASPVQEVGVMQYGGAYDAVAERVVTYTYRTTWFYATPFQARATPYGTGCAGSAGVLQLAASSRPWLGDTVAGALAPLAATALPFVVFGFSDTVWNGQPLPLSLAPLGAPGCSVFAEPLVASMLPGGGASAPWSLVLPNTTAFAGLSLFAQGGAFDLPANPLGLATSDALALRLGIR